MRTIIVILTLVLVGCKTHMFENVVECDSIFDHIDNKKQLNLSEFNAYYSCTYRNEDKLEMVVKGEPTNTAGFHLTDVQYLLINEQTKEFIHIAYIPTRYTTKGIKYYIDTYLRDYRTKINIYYINQLHYGKIENGKLVYLYKSGNFKISDKYLHISYSLNGTNLKLATVETEKANTPKALNLVVNEQQLIFTQMKESELIFYGTDDNKSYTVQNQIILTTFNRHKRTHNLLSGIGSGNRNMILFNLAEIKTISEKNTVCNPPKDGKRILGIWYGESGARFKFFYK